ncbi:MAG: hypothetical protein QM689_00765 [Oscillospiraceae bacterium]
MKLMIFILSRTEVLAQFLEGLSTAGIKGATILDSEGLAATVSRLDGNFFGASLRALFSTAEGNKTILSLISDDQIELVRKVCYATVGNLSEPNTGILFTVPVDFAEGIVKTDRNPV